jgi:translocator protein
MPAPMTSLRTSKLMILPFLLAMAGVGLFGGAFRPGTWYKGLIKPWFTPPDWLFGPVWTGLYILIAIAGYLVWRRAGVSVALLVWFANIVLNALWSLLMFGQHRIDLALLDIGAMWLTIIGFMVAAYGIDRRATWCFAPYLGWVSLATALNFALWRMN